MRAELTIAALVLGALAGVSPARAADPPPIVRPPAVAGQSPVERGRQLFAANCATCHGLAGEGVAPGNGRRGVNGIDGAGPPLLDAGALAADFYLTTGYMPLGHPDDQPVRSSPRFDRHEIAALTDYVASLGSGPPVPDPDPGSGDVARGLELFTEHCAGCHQVVGEGGVVTGAKVPPLDRATPRQVWEAARIGPYVMPKFTARDISDDELNSIVAYVEYAKDPDDRGGWGIDHLGPFPEGLVTWGLAMLVLIATCVLIGERGRR